MPAGRPDVDPAVLRLLLRRLTELEGEAHGVTDTVLGHVPYAGPGVPEATIAEIGTALVDAFSTLGDSMGRSSELLARRHPTAVEPPAEIDLRVVHLGAFEELAR